jgi:FMN-dependent NADH-azoreductase
MAASAAVLDEFLAADIVVIGAPMYNFTVPTQLKAWIDRILVAGKTFRYGPQGVEGLAAGKRVIVAISRGGFYGYGTPAAPAEHLETYLRAVFGFIGITNPEFIIAEGVQIGRDQREKAIEEALRNATMLRPPDRLVPNSARRRQLEQVGSPRLGEGYLAQRQGSRRSIWRLE